MYKQQRKSKTMIPASASHLVLLLYLFLLFRETKPQKGGGGKDVKPSLDSEFQKSILQSSPDSYQVLLSATGELQEKEKTTSIEVPVASIPAGGTSKTSQYFPSLSSGPLAPLEKELGCFEVQLHSSFQSHFYKKTLFFSFVSLCSHWREKLKSYIVRNGWRRIWEVRRKISRKCHQKL